VEARDTELGDLIISEHADLRWLVSTAILDSTPADTPKSASRERNQVVRPYFVLKPVPKSRSRREPFFFDKGTVQADGID